MYLLPLHWRPTVRPAGRTVLCCIHNPSRVFLIDAVSLMKLFPPAAPVCALLNPSRPPQALSRRAAIIGAAIAFVGIKGAPAEASDRVIVVDGWVVKQYELRIP